MYFVAFATAFVMCRKEIRERNFPMTDDDLSGLFFWSILGLLLGARIFSTIVYEPSSIYREQPWLIFWPFKDGEFTGLQGMSYHGGVIGCVTGAVLWSIFNKQDVREIGDMLSAAIPLGYTFGRIGNFINAELYGRVTTAPWGMIFPNAKELDPRLEWVREAAAKTGVDIPVSASGVSPFINLPRHPSQLYEAFLEGVFLWFIIWLARNKKPFKGFLVSLYLIGYGVLRFFIEYFRQPDSDLGYKIQLAANKAPLDYIHPLTSFSTGQVFCFIMILIGIAGLVIFPRLPNSKPLIVYPKQSDAKLVQGDTNKIKERNKQKNIRRKLK
jgi:phosphatidylglycerol:prolipoprotein diacylglycerol transferase